MSESKNRHNSKARSASDIGIKIGFLIVAIGVMVWIYSIQKRDPKMPGWGTRLDRALKVAASNDTKVVVAFTHSPMRRADKLLVTKALTWGTSRQVLAELKYQRVHLTDKYNRSEMDKYGIRKLPTVILLDSSGNELKRHEGFMTDLTFCNDILGKSASGISTSP